MLQFLVRRFLAMVPIVVLVSIISFAIVQVLPGDVALAILGEERARNEAAYEQVRSDLGLDRPLPVRYLAWIGSALTGDLGTSYRTREAVSEALARRLAPTLQLALISLVIGVAIGIPLGVVSATNRGGWLDSTSTLLALWSVAIPNFWLGILLIYLFSITLGWLPPSGYVSFLEAPIESLKLMIMPAIALGTGLAGVVLRQTRSAVLEVLGDDYIRTARSKGIRNAAVLNKHALRNALIPVITVIGMQLGRLIGGTVTVEIVFSIPGMGRLAADTIYFRDFPVLQGIMLITALAVLIASFVTDVVYSFIDPRIQYA